MLGGVDRVTVIRVPDPGSTVTFYHTSSDLSNLIKVNTQAQNILGHVVGANFFHKKVICKIIV